MDQKTRMLSQVPLFTRLGGSALEQVGKLTDEVDVKPGTELTHQGRPGGEFFIILEGTVEVRRDGELLRTMGPGEFLGEIALVDGGPRSATAVATGPTRLLVLTSPEFHTLIADHAEVRLSVLAALAERVRNLDAHAGA
jgi:CRP/FNR family cyclic AMP-dependent transcriptional regulator